MIDFATTSITLLKLFGSKVSAEVIDSFGTSGAQIRDIIIDKAGNYLWEKIRFGNETEIPEVEKKINDALSEEELELIKNLVNKIIDERPEGQLNTFNFDAERLESKSIDVEDFQEANVKLKDARIDNIAFSGSKKK